MYRIILFLAVFNLCFQSLSGQDYYETVKGRVIDKDAHSPVRFATVVISAANFSKGTITDDQGYFVFENVPVGRAALEARFVGYETSVLSNLMVTTGKQLVLQIELTESPVEINEVTVKAFENKDKPRNTYATTSARMFTIEESQRYAGAGNDVSRMAMNFAGVKSTNETVNEIVIRGNSPVGLLFRLDGIDIPNSNHFGDGGTSGGVLSMLNNNVLANSDFLTGAFPAEYGNTISGVFDLKMRNGNKDKHEFLGQVGIMGSEFGAEGPISRKNKSSYLVNYRYSTTKLMTTFIDVGLGSTIPNYQDGSIKLNFPTKKSGNFSIIGFGGKSSIAFLDSERDTTLAKPEMTDVLNYETDAYNDNYCGALGLTHTYIIGNSAYTRIILSATTISNKNIQDSLSLTTRKPFLQYASDFKRTKYTAKFYVNKKVNRKSSYRAGLSTELQHFHLSDSILDEGIYRLIRNFSGNGFLLQPYVQYRHKMNDQLTFGVGLASVYQSVSSHFSAEPRLGITWEPINSNTFSFAYGLHSLSTPVEIVHQKVKMADGTYIQPNKSLGFTRSHHFVVGYDKIFQRNIRLKTEMYYQLITNAGIEVEKSSFSMLNRGSTTFTDATNLKNGGKGYNYGIELTLEKFMNRGMYFLTTLSLYESKYKGSDGIWRNTAFNSNYVVNLLGGKEFALGSGKKDKKFIKRLSVDAKYNLAGGQRYSPIDLLASREAGITKYDDSRAFSEQLPCYMNIDLRLALKFIGKNATQEIAIDISNLTNRKNPFFLTYDDDIDDVKMVYQFGLMPDILYRIVF